MRKPMRKPILLTIAFVAGLLVAQLPAPRASAAPPGSQTSYDVSTQSQKDYLSRHELVAKEVAHRARILAHNEAAVIVWTARRDTLAAKARAGLVDHTPALESLLPAILTDIALGYADESVPPNGVRDPGEDDVVKLWVNADAAINRASPPPGIVVGP